MQGMALLNAIMIERRGPYVLQHERIHKRVQSNRLRSNSLVGAEGLEPSLEAV
jgi:hypothetical protein